MQYLSQLVSLRSLSLAVALASQQLAAIISAEASEALKHVITLDSGERLVGTISSTSDAVIVLESSLLGSISLPSARVVSNEVLEGQSKEQPVDTQIKPLKSDAAELSNTDDSSDAREPLQAIREYKAPDAWKGKLRFGLNLSTGDSIWTETVLNGVLEIQHPDSHNFYRFNGKYNYRTSENAQGESFKTIDKYEAGFIYRRAFGQSWFAQNSFGGRVDQRKGIDLELQEVVGIGYKYKPVESVEIILGGGGGVEKLEADFSVSSGELEPIGNIFQELEWALFDRTSFVQNFTYFWNTENTSDYNYIISAALRVRLTELLGIEFSYSQNYDNFTDLGNVGDDTRWRNALVVYF